MREANDAEVLGRAFEFEPFDADLLGRRRASATNTYQPAAGTRASAW